MNSKLKLAAFALAVASSALGAVPASADTLGFTWTSVPAITAVNVPFAYSASLVNATSDSVYLNSVAITSDELLGGVQPFFDNSPLFLRPGESWSGHVLDITATQLLSPGAYHVLITIQGGPGANDVLDLVNSDLGISVAIVPEPSTSALMLLGLVGLMLRAGRSRAVGAVPTTRPARGVASALRDALCCG
jgi:PEP-CTERM motif